MIESKYLKDNIQNIQKLMSLTPLRKFETDKLRQLIRLSKIREYGSGEIIIEEGEEDPYLYFLLKGKVRVRKESLKVWGLTQSECWSNGVLECCKEKNRFLGHYSLARPDKIMKK